MKHLMNIRLYLMIWKIQKKKHQIWTRHSQDHQSTDLYKEKHSKNTKVKDLIIFFKTIKIKPSVKFWTKILLLPRTLHYFLKLDKGKHFLKLCMKTPLQKLNDKTLRLLFWMIKRENSNPTRFQFLNLSVDTKDYLKWAMKICLIFFQEKLLTHLLTSCIFDELQLSPT